MSVRCPNLNELPPPDGKTGLPCGSGAIQRGWPWTEETPQLPDTMPDGRHWPRISIVTPSYNQGQFLEETIRSVLLQNYPNLEYIIIDGGSNDNSVEIIKKYEPWLTYWVSEKDNGQTNAINKGFDVAYGSIRGYLNSDDLLMPSALEAVAQVVVESSENRLVVMGDCAMGYDLDRIFDIWKPSVPLGFADSISRDSICPQPATFWTDPVVTPCPRLNERLRFVMDYDFWCTLIRIGYTLTRIDKTLAFYRHHDEAKGNNFSDVMWSELAGSPLINATFTKSFKEKVFFGKLARRRYRHFLRLEIEKSLASAGKWSALGEYLSAVKADPGMLRERPTLGLARKILWSR